jgi:hypothetical protein
MTEEVLLYTQELRALTENQQSQNLVHNVWLRGAKPVAY